MKTDRKNIFDQQFRNIMWFFHGKGASDNQIKNPTSNILHLISFLLLSSTLILSSCCKCDDPEPYNPTPYLIDIPYGFPTNLNIPEDNPMTLEGVELGRMLFYDGRLNGRTHPDSLMSCFTCHRQESSFEIGIPRPHPFGVTGQPTHHAMLPMINLVWNPGNFGWNGSVGSIEEDVLGVISDPSEFHSSPAKVIHTIENISAYPPPVS